MAKTDKPQKNTPMIAAPEATPFRRNLGLRYTEFVDGLHQAMAFDWYLEVGCRAGRSFAPVTGKTIAVDPFFKVEINAIGVKPKLLVFQQTSDDFFADGYLKKLGIQLSYSFLDGMHLFEYLLRDFINTEANSDPKGVIAMHDCLPFGARQLTRDLKNLPRGPWTGDVWKLLPILQRYRPELKLTVLTCRPTGLVFVTNLDPSNTVLKDNYDKILAEWLNQDMLEYGLDKFYSIYEPLDPEEFAAAGYPIFADVRLDPGLAHKPTKVTK
ncbi:MAG: hypothetical protein JWS10_2136 [Cypionkella sp.]|nr:hypothetical protein [Cypionkella sp.]MDB5663936.1 hypothetical protein [Cypionkella sp.]